MVFVYILAKVETGSEIRVLDSLKDSGQVKRTSITYGTYDLCIEAQFETMEELDDFVFNKVRKIDDIRETATLVVARTRSRE